MSRTLLLTLILAVLTMSHSAQACPSCKDTVANGDASASGGGDASSGMSGSGVPSGFNTSIYLMLGAFLGVVGLVSVTLIRGARASSPRPGSEVKPKKLGQE